MPHWFRTGPLQKSLIRNWLGLWCLLTWCAVISGQARGAKGRTSSWQYCWIFPPKNYCRKTGHKVRAYITEQGIPSRAKTNTSRKKGKTGSVSSHISPQRSWWVGSCFNNDSLNWWQCSLELSLDPVLCFIKHLMKKRKVIATRKDVSECYSAELMLSWSLHASVTFQRLRAFIVKELAANKIMISNTRVHILTF